MVFEEQRASITSEGAERTFEKGSEQGVQLGTSWEMDNAGCFKSMEPHLRDSEEALEAVWGRGAGGHQIHGFQRWK